jgi:CheY-like chemotaxis protein
MRILYVEDEPADAQLVERYVQLTPHQLVVASNVQDAKAAMKNIPDLILVDVLLGSTRDGYALVRDLRRQGYARPIVAVTALTTPYDIDQCFEAGFDEVLGKPYAINQLVDILDRYAV